MNYFYNVQIFYLIYFTISFTLLSCKVHVITIFHFNLRLSCKLNDAIQLKSVVLLTINLLKWQPYCKVARPERSLPLIVNYNNWTKGLHAVDGWMAIWFMRTFINLFERYSSARGELFCLQVQFELNIAFIKKFNWEIDTKKAFYFNPKIPKKKIISSESVSSFPYPLKPPRVALQSLGRKMIENVMLRSTLATSWTAETGLIHPLGPLWRRDVYDVMGSNSYQSPWFQG